MMRSAEYTDLDLISNPVQRRKTIFFRPRSGHKVPTVRRKRSHTYSEIEDHLTKAVYDYIDPKSFTAPQQSGVDPTTGKKRISDSSSDEESKVGDIQKTLRVIMNQMYDIQSRQSDFDARLSALENIHAD